MAIIACALYTFMMKTRSFLVRSFSLMVILAVSSVGLWPSMSMAKGGDEQEQIIALNDSAAALEDLDPKLSKELTEFADERELDWEAKNANKDLPPAPSAEEDKKLQEYRVQLLKKAAVEIKPNYPLIAKTLERMSKDISNALEIQH